MLFTYQSSRILKNIGVRSSFLADRLFDAKKTDVKRRGGKSEIRNPKRLISAGKVIVNRQSSIVNRQLAPLQLFNMDSLNILGASDV